MLQRLLIGVLLSLTLAACEAPRQTSTYTSPTTGVTTSIESDRESCLSRCNKNFDRCGDQESVRRPSDPYGPRDLFGAGADCRQTLGNCMNSCKGR